MTEKSFGRVLGESLVTALVLVPATFIGLGVGGHLWSNKVEPWLNKDRSKKSHEDREEES